MPFARVFQGCLSGAEPELLLAHEEALMRCFCDELAACGGKRLSAAELLRQWRLLFLVGLVGQIQFIESDIKNEGVPFAEWPSIVSRDDPRIMGRWNVRCRTIALIDAVGFYQRSHLHNNFMAWVSEQGLL